MSAAQSTDEVIVRGPYFDELHVGQVFDTAPAVTLTSGMAATHQAIVGDRLRLPLSAPMALAVTGRESLAHPGLVCDVAIGQSTLVTQHVRANLFYRGLLLRRQPQIGDTLHTVTTIEALKQNKVRPDRPATGLAVLRMVTTDQDGESVLDFWRCAMIPLSDPAQESGHNDDLSVVGRNISDDDLLMSVTNWNLPEPSSEPIPVGRKYRVVGADVVSSAPELARLSLNVAAVHHDAQAAGGRRLVYGGHTIAIAMGQASRALPDLLTVLGWHSCDHLAPVHEGDRLTSTIDVERVDEHPAGGQVLHLRSQVTAQDSAGGDPVVVLDWRFVALNA
ncbi:MAG: Acyl dehydratase-like protein [Pseudonocardiales bacterium]|nr:Acyl dehydratase-like protein [Pseudonocardiales bacterium]